jgi:hypothetical protein
MGTLLSNDHDFKITFTLRDDLQTKIVGCARFPRSSVRAANVRSSRARLLVSRRGARHGRP